MKKFLKFFACSILFSLCASVFAEDTYAYDMTVTAITGVKAPYISGNYIVFTAPNNCRSVGIAVDFENYKTIHQFHLHKTYDSEGEVTDSWFFYLLEKPRKTESISYRLIIDGLWTTDPMNSKTVYDYENGLLLSNLEIPPETQVFTENYKTGLTHFVCLAESGQKIRLGGTFTNWDSWIYEMKETRQGVYELDLPLPSGTYYYSYYKGITAFVDETNPVRGYSSDGRVVSCITVD